jgi:hypothetical protein
MNFDEFKSEFIKWIIDKIEPVRLNGFSICPYAKQARLLKKIQFIDASDKIYNTFLSFDDSKYEVGIAWLGETVDNTNKLLEKLNIHNQKFFYFISTPKTGYFVKNFTNCIFIQKKEDILNKRKLLFKTDYYKNWPEDYFNKIVGSHDK